MSCLRPVGRNQAVPLTKDHDPDSYSNANIRYSIQWLNYQTIDCVFRYAFILNINDERNLVLNYIRLEIEYFLVFNRFLMSYFNMPDIKENILGFWSGKSPPYPSV